MAFKTLDQPATAKTCEGIKGLISEGDDHVGEDYDHDGSRRTAVGRGSQ